MSMESLLLALWEQDGFVGRARVPLGRSDVDVLAVRAQDGAVRVGEVKARATKTTVFVVDRRHVRAMSQDQQGFSWWMERGWSGWLGNLPKLWNDDGTEFIPWLPPLSEVASIQVTFLANLWVVGDERAADRALRVSAKRALRTNPSIKRCIKGGLKVKATVESTGTGFRNLARSVFSDPSFG